MDCKENNLHVDEGFLALADRSTQRHEKHSP